MKPTITRQLLAAFNEQQREFDRTNEFDHTPAHRLDDPRVIAWRDAGNCADLFAQLETAPDSLAEAVTDALKLLLDPEATDTVDLRERAEEANWSVACRQQHGLPALLDFDTTFLNIFDYVLENGYLDLRDPDDLPGDELRVLLDGCIHETLAVLGLPTPEGDELEWLGYLHDLVGEAYPDIEARIEETTE